MKVIVLGSGVIGICAAYYLNKAGHEVTVIDRQEGPGQETSFANGGQISASHAAPWAAPSVPLQMLKWLGRADAPLLYHFRLDWRQWVWSLRFLMNCLPSRARRNTIGNMRICLYSRALMPEIREDTGIEYDHRPDGILQIYENRNDLDSSARHAMWLRELGCDNKVLTRQECIALEPALAERADQLAGGIYTETDESGDAYKFTHELAAVCAARGVSFHYGETIEAIAADGARNAQFGQDVPDQRRGGGFAVGARDPDIARVWCCPGEELHVAENFAARFACACDDRVGVRVALRNARAQHQHVDVGEFGGLEVARR